MPETEEMETDQHSEDLRVVMPGDLILTAKDVKRENKRIVLGPGIKSEQDNIVATKAGILRKKKPNTYWVDSYQKRYIPVRGECVVGVVIQKAGDIFRVDIGASEPASLSYLAFEGATKKNRPDVNVGDVIYAKLLIASKELEPELVCVDSHGKKGKLGVLVDGFVFNSTINLVRKILRDTCPLLKCLQNEMPFELAAGMNGRIWIKAKTVKATIAVGNAILASEHKSDEAIKEVCTHIAEVLAGF